MSRALIGLLLLLALLISYGLGNISPSILIARAKGHDIRREGSGNAGTTNTLRVLGKKYAALVLLIDVAKGAAAVFLARAVLSLLPPEEASSLGFFVYLCGLAAFCGHVWPAAFGFRGGKGVATAFGVLLSVDWRIGLLCLAVAALLLLLTRIMSVSTLTASLCALPFSYFWERGFLPWALILVLLIFVKHRANLQRLIAGNEKRLDFKK